jgi:N-acetylated-alpha-linked acidic dipeptidase
MRGLAIAILLLATPFAGELFAQAPAPGASFDATARKQPESDHGKPLGFLARSRPDEARAEHVALAVPTPENARKWLKQLTQEPHVAGTRADRDTALFVEGKLREWGWKTEIKTYKVLLNYPRGEPSLSITRPAVKVLPTNEKPIDTDKDSASTAAFGAFHGYGVSGSASGQVVYANYARPEDFEALDRMGVSVRDKIVLARYGGNFRGLKLLNAQRRGARGILIYSDPADDGYARGDVYPHGPFRPGSSIQRGSVQFLSLGPGDPSTPHGPSVEGADRLPIDLLNGFPMNGPKGSLPNDRGTEWEAQTGLKRDEYYATIPSLPLSYDNAHELLKHLAGPNVPSGWQGGLPLAYHVGPGPLEVSFSIGMDYQIRDIWDVMATIPGAVEPDQWIMIGNHRDAWVHGAVDPGSGTAATMEMCRAIGSAYKSGWKPRRTLVYANWDAEEYGLVGSTEWAEEHEKDVDRKAVLMLNVDSAVSGPELGMAGVPSLRDLALDAAGAITDARSGKSLRSVWLDAQRKSWSSSSPLNLADPLWDALAGKQSHASQPSFVPQLRPLGSGSDYTAFLDHLGVPCLDVGFGGNYGVYHSIFDSFTWMEKECDPEFLTHTTAARLYTVMMMRAAAADVLPMRFVPYGEALREHLDNLRLAQARDARGKAGESKEPGNEFDGAKKLAEAIQDFGTKAQALDQKLDALSQGEQAEAHALSQLNERLVRVERALLLPKGLPGRPWFRHAVFAPGLTTGYGAWPLPAVRQALEKDSGLKVNEQAEVTAAAITQASKALEAAREAADKALQAR